MPRTLRAMVQELLTEHDGPVTERLLKGLLGRDAHRYFAIAAALEKQQVELTGKDGGPIEVHDHFHVPPAR